MAELALGTECSKCHTLTACAGSRTDEILTGQCGGCGSPVAMRNYENPSHPNDPATVEPLEAPSENPAPEPAAEEPVVEPEVTPEPEANPQPEEPVVEPEQSGPTV